MTSSVPPDAILPRRRHAGRRSIPAVNLQAEREVAAMQARIEELGQASLVEIAALREEQRAMHTQLDAALAQLAGSPRTSPR